MLGSTGLRGPLAWEAAFLLGLPGAAGALTWELQVADPRSDAIYTSLVLDSQGRPHVSGMDFNTLVLIYTRFYGSAGRSEVVDGGCRIPRAPRHWSGVPDE